MACPPDISLKLPKTLGLRCESFVLFELDFRCARRGRSCAHGTRAVEVYVVDNVAVAVLTGQLDADVLDVV